MFGATVVVLVLATAGCGGGGVDVADATATTVEPSTTTEPISPPTTLTDEQAVLAAYQGYWDTCSPPTTPPNPDHPDLAKYATGEALDSGAGLNRQHRLLRAKPCDFLRTARRVIEAQSLRQSTATRQSVIDCSVDDGVLVDRPVGRVLNDAVRTFGLCRVDLEQVGRAMAGRHESRLERQREGI